MDWEQVKPVMEEIQNRTKRNAYALKIDVSKTPKVCDSKFGGMPYWDLSKPYPTDSKGNKLMLLAQINFDKLGAEEPLPDKGMLQFFIGLDEVYGMDFDKQDKQDTFRVVYHDTIDYNVSLEQIAQLEPPVSTNLEIQEFTPIWKEVAVSIEQREVYMGISDYRFEPLFAEIAKEKLGMDLKNQSLYKFLSEEDFNKVDELNDNTGHWLYAYSYFTQTDPREYGEKYRYYDTLLFQMDSDYINSEDYILWGDCGVANFFINGEDLKNKDFSKVLYNWDCC